MLPLPTRYTLAAGAAEGVTELNAFDNALLAAGIGNLNLIRVSSILPAGARRTEYLDLPAGSLTPTAYGTLTSATPGERIAAAVAVAVSESGFGVIMEFTGRCTREQAEAQVRAMAEEALAGRGLAVRELHVRAVDHQVERIGCVVAAVALWG
ncbi:MAG: arginine decarboxylase, pyruvoyl-dependent [Limnochordaceae bacterium]|nr:arginine decarboxylase, pyruvoyl-dependent [Limnochordaceae bacterium]